jgi:hypothetical protein
MDTFHKAKKSSLLGNIPVENSDRGKEASDSRYAMFPKRILFVDGYGART